MGNHEVILIHSHHVETDVLKAKLQDCAFTSAARELYEKLLTDTVGAEKLETVEGIRAYMERSQQDEIGMVVFHPHVRFGRVGRIIATNLFGYKPLVDVVRIKKISTDDVVRAKQTGTFYLTGYPDGEKVTDISVSAFGEIKNHSLYAIKPVIIHPSGPAISESTW